MAKSQSKMRIVTPEVVLSGVQLSLLRLMLVRPILEPLLTVLT